MTLRALLFWLALFASAQAADWQPNVQNKTYAISGTTGAALYESIGARGPTPLPGRRAIAYTGWDLKWRRDYQPQNGGCVLVSALPFLTITYTLPKPEQKLSGATAQKWQVFSEGIITHELYHGQLLREMTDRIIAETVGLKVAGDSGCKEIRNQVLARVKAAYDDYRDQSAAFDRLEMSPGGNVHGLILHLVN